MTTKRFPLYQDIINLILAYLVIISIDMVLSSGMRAHIPVIEYVAIALIGLYTYILKEFVTKMYIYAALHMVMVAICIFIPADELSKVKIVIIAVVYCIIDAHNWISGLKSSEDVHVGLLGAIFFSFIFCSGKYEFGYSKAVYYMGVMFIVLVLVRMIVTNFYDLSRSGQLTDDMPVRELFKNNSLIASGIIVMIVTFMIFVRSDELIRILNNWLYNIMEKIVGVIFRAVLEEPENGTDDLLGFLNPNNLPQQDEGGFVYYLIRILEAVLAVFIIILLIWILVKIVTGIFSLLTDTRERRFHGYRSYKVKNEIRERLSRDEVSSERSRSLFLTPVEKLRHIYRKELISYKKSGVEIRSYKTPKEHCDLIYSSKGHDISEVTGIYERARYKVGYEVTSKDISELKAGFKTSKRSQL